MYRGLLLLSLATLLIVGGTLAWFTASADPVTNVFTAGTVKINLVDRFLDDMGNELEGRTMEDVNPGDVFCKEVYVENTGSKCAVIVIELTPKVSLKAISIDDDIVPGGPIRPNADPPSLPPSIGLADGTEVMKFDIDSGWQPIPGEKYKYFWGKCVCPTDNPSATEPLFVNNEVRFLGAEMKNHYQGATFEIKVSAKAIQCSNDAPAEWGLQVDENNNVSVID